MKNHKKVLFLLFYSITKVNVLHCRYHLLLRLDDAVSFCSVIGASVSFLGSLHLRIIKMNRKIMSTETDRLFLTSLLICDVITADM